MGRRERGTMGNATFKKHNWPNPNPFFFGVMYILCFLIDFANYSSISSQIAMKVSRFIILSFI
jgi:hypothetical protein